MKKTYKRPLTVLWAGNDESFNTYMIALEQSIQDAKGFVSDRTVNASPTQDEEANRLLTITDDVGIIDVKGVLTNTDAWYNRYFGLVAYEEIVDALYQAALSPGVTEIFLNVDSPGGAVNGVLDAVSAVRKVGKVKRITAFTSSIAASAGYWLIAPAKERYATATATVGSIGVVAKHVEYSKMMEMEGVTETIIRAGEFKQLANSSEPLSQKAEKDLQERVDYTYGIFVQSVADSLGLTYQVVDRQMAQGREFIGQQCVDRGLINGVSSFEDVFARVQARVSKQRNSGGQDMKKKYGMAAALAAASAGVEMEAATEAAETEETVALATPATPATEVVEAVTETPATEAAAESDVAALLKSQLKEKDEELLTARVQLRDQETKLAGLSSLQAIVAEVVNNMTVALGGSKDEKLAGQEPVALMSLYETTKARTMEVFKSGGLARHEAGEAPAVPKTSRMDAAVSAAAVKTTK